jgi:DNA transposition AAA+ family ATPase
MPTAEFLLTKESRRFEEFCNAYRRDQSIGLCYEQNPQSVRRNNCSGEQISR